MSPKVTSKFEDISINDDPDAFFISLAHARLVPLERIQINQKGDIQAHHPFELCKQEAVVSGLRIIVSP